MSAPPTLLDNFKPVLRCLTGNTYEASIRLPVVGDVTTNGNGWEEAKMRLWLVSEAVKMLASKQCKDPKDWTEDEWRRTLQTMKNVWSSNDKLTDGSAKNL